MFPLPLVFISTFVTFASANIDLCHFQRIPVNKDSYLLESTTSVVNFYHCAKTFQAASKASPTQYVFFYDRTAKTCQVGTVSTSDIANEISVPEVIGVYFERESFTTFLR